MRTSTQAAIPSSTAPGVTHSPYPKGYQVFQPSKLLVGVECGGLTSCNLLMLSSIPLPLFCSLSLYFVHLYWTYTLCNIDVLCTVLNNQFYNLNSDLTNGDISNLITV